LGKPTLDTAAAGRGIASDGARQYAASKHYDPAILQQIFEYRIRARGQWRAFVSTGGLTGARTWRSSSHEREQNARGAGRCFRLRQRVGFGTGFGGFLKDNILAMFPSASRSARSGMPPRPSA